MLNCYNYNFTSLNRFDVINGETTTESPDFLKYREAFLTFEKTYKKVRIICKGRKTMIKQMKKNYGLK